MNFKTEQKWFIMNLDCIKQEKVHQNRAKEGHNGCWLCWIEKSGAKLVPNGLKRSLYKSKLIKSGSNLEKISRKLVKMSKNKVLKLFDMFWRVLTYSDVFWHILTRFDEFWWDLTDPDKFTTFCLCIGYIHLKLDFGVQWYQCYPQKAFIRAICDLSHKNCSPDHILHHIFINSVSFFP